MTSPRILLIEDTVTAPGAWQDLARLAGHRTTRADGATGLTQLEAEPPDLVLLDLHLKDRDALDLLGRVLARQPGLPVIVLASDATENKAQDAIAEGAIDWLPRPVELSRLRLAVDKALRHSNGAAPETVADLSGPTGDFIGTSPEMQQVYRRIRTVARSMATVFITGESGTGKDLCAEAIHAHSNRADGPFIALSCGAIPAELVESEVFGHLKGSFNGAISDRMGAAASADGGTLFLDDICELDPSLQVKLLRFLQNSTIQPVGASEPRKVDVRIICATNRDPLEAIRAGQFREDLFYRLHVVPIHMPPLRRREEDILAIADATLRRFAHEEGRNFAAFSAEVKAIFRGHPWPGNVRQLLNVIRHVVVLNDGHQVTPEMLPDGMLPARPAAVEVPVTPTDLTATLGLLLGRPLAEIERLVIEHALDKTGGSVPRAARLLEVAPSTLYRKIEVWRRG